MFIRQRRCGGGAALVHSAGGPLAAGCVSGSCLHTLRQTHPALPRHVSPFQLRRTTRAQEGGVNVSERRINQVSVFCSTVRKTCKTNNERLVKHWGNTRRSVGHFQEYYLGVDSTLSLSSIYSYLIKSQLCIATAKPDNISYCTISFEYFKSYTFL